MHLLTLFRRHGAGCAAKRALDEYTTESDERRRSQKRCRCRIYARGTLDGRYKNWPTRQREWDRAKEVIAPFEAAGSWDADPTPLPPSQASETRLGLIRPGDKPPLPIEAAVAQCLKEHADAHDARGTIKAYRVVLTSFATFSQQLGVRYLEEWTSPLVRQLRSHWLTERKNSPVSAGKKLGLLKAFFEIFVEDGVLAVNPARIRARRNRALKTGEKMTDDAVPAGGRQKNPFTDEELARIFDACVQLSRAQRRQSTRIRRGVAVLGAADRRRPRSGDDLADFCQLSLYTGLRISDVATFHADRLDADGRVKLRATKNGVWVSVPVPEFIRTMIRRRAAIHGPIIFGPYTTQNMDVITYKWHRLLRDMSKVSGPWAEKPTHHRFRHTFIRILLERNVPISLIADLAGDSEVVIRRHYSAWVPGRQENVNRVLEEAFANVPRAHAG